MFIGAVGFNENSTSASGTTYLRILRQSVNYVCHNPNLPLAISHGNTKYVCQALASWDSGRREVAKCSPIEHGPGVSAAPCTVFTHSLSSTINILWGTFCINPILGLGRLFRWENSFDPLISHFSPIVFSETGVQKTPGWGTSCITLLMKLQLFLNFFIGEIEMQQLCQ